MNNDVDKMTEAELVEHFYRHRDDLAGDEIEEPHTNPTGRHDVRKFRPQKGGAGR